VATVARVGDGAVTGIGAGSGVGSGVGCGVVTVAGDGDGAVAGTAAGSSIGGGAGCTVVAGTRRFWNLRVRRQISLVMFLQVTAANATVLPRR
jgi:hypothetical protein